MLSSSWEIDSAKTISRVRDVASVKIVFQNQNITQVSPAEVVRRGVCKAPEGRRVFPEMTVFENLEMGAYVRTRSAPIHEDLECVFRIFPVLGSRGGQIADTLSGGEQQMLTIGRGLMARPKLLLLDEPSMGLAPTLVRTIFETVKAISEEGTTVLLVEQNAVMALSIAKRGCVIESGRVVLEDTSEGLLRNAKIQDAYLGKPERQRTNKGGSHE